jgi:hypothetical protein
VTALLQRKSSWVPADVSRFTELYAAEHETETAVAAAKARYTQLGDDVELLQLKMVDLIRERYQQVCRAWGGVFGGGLCASQAVIRVGAFGVLCCVVMLCGLVLLLWLATHSWVMM